MDTSSSISLGVALIAPVATVMGAGITAYFGYKSVKSTADIAKDKEQLSGLKRELIFCYRQISAYYQLEQELIRSVTTGNGKTEQSSKIEHRDKVEKKGYERPSVTHSQADKRIRELEI